MKSTFTHVSAAMVVSVLAIATGPGQTPNPDFTQGESIPEGVTHFYNLGATGARGWMHSHGLETTAARQIMVTEVAEGSPADGVLKTGDVILGVFSERFRRDPREELGTALTRAEAGDGALPLIVWRDGANGPISVPLAPLGAYSATAPFDCPKSARILERGSKALAERMKQSGYARSQNTITRSLNALALLATGDPEFLPLVRREAEWAAGFSANSMQVWWNAHAIMLLAEYQIATGDASFAGGLERLALESARGQSIVGSWGHGFAGADGRLGGYGMLNASGLPLLVSLVMAREAGIDHPDLDTAIERGARLIRFYAGKGSVPYGDHAPARWVHDENGKAGMAAVLFNLLEEEENTEFFARMSVASHSSERDTGHTGNFTNMLWAMPAVSLGGPQATGGWMREFGFWYFDLTRAWDFHFTHPGPPGLTPDSFRGWDATGSYLLAYAMGKQHILLTGKPPKLLDPFDAALVESLLRDGRGWSNNDRHSAYDSLNEAQFLEKLGSWSPTVRERAATALARRARGSGEFPVETLISMLESPSLNARYGACRALEMAGRRSAPAVPALIAQLDHDDMWLRCEAANALGRIGQPALPALPKLLDRIAQGPGPDDPRGMEQRYLSFAVFQRLLGNSIDQADRAALQAAVVAALCNEDGHSRSAVSTIYRHLDDEQVRALIPAIREAIVTPSPSGLAFSEGVRLAGLELMASRHIEEGMEIGVDYLTSQNPWGSERRINDILKHLEKYGAHAQAMVPRMLEIADAMEQGEPDFPRRLSRQKARAIRDSVKRINASTERPPLLDPAQGP